MPRSNKKLPPHSERCGCTFACNYYMLRCDNCHRGVHFTCLNLSDPVADRPNVYVCTTCKNDGVEEARVAEIRTAEGKPCFVIFRGTCQYHVKYACKRDKVRPLADEHSDEVLRDACCDICNHTCRGFSVACDKCDAYWHALCVPLTIEQVDRIDKWYCKRCRNKDPQLRITFEDGHGNEEEGTVMSTSPPGPSSGPSAFVPCASAPASQRKKRPITTKETTTRPTKRIALNDRTAKTEPPAEVVDAQAGQVPPLEAPANAMPTVDEHMAEAEGPTTASLLEQLKQAADRFEQLEEENAALLRDKLTAAAAKEGLQTTLDETKAELAKKNVLIAHLTAKLVDAGHL
ncbi:cpG-binding protein isoform 1 [Aphelenchoides avenae]|nr:cpG-binding protein isoform 1 [Aphelenchus avenae]